MLGPLITLVPSFSRSASDHQNNIYARIELHIYAVVSWLHREDDKISIAMKVYHKCYSSIFPFFSKIWD